MFARIKIDKQYWKEKIQESSYECTRWLGITFCLVVLAMIGAIINNHLLYLIALIFSTVTLILGLGNLSQTVFASHLIYKKTRKVNRR